MSPTSVNCADVRCLQCGNVVADRDVSDECSLLVSVLLADCVTYDAVLLVHPECMDELLTDGCELLNVKALGHALILAAECAARSKLSPKDAERSEPPASRAVRPMRPGTSH